MHSHSAPLSRFATRRHVLVVAGQTIELIAPENPDALLDDPLIEQRYQADNYLPYWPIVWPAGLMLAEHIFTSAHSPPDSMSASALELGCGLGTAGIAAAQRGWHVTFTDYDPEAVEFARHNAAINGVPPQRIAGVQMDWRRPLAEKFSWIIAADVLYERRLHPLLLGAIRQLLAPGGCVWITDPLRSSAEEFPMAAVHAGFSISEFPLERVEDGLLQKGNLYILRAAGQKF